MNNFKVFEVEDDAIKRRKWDSIVRKAVLDVLYFSYDLKVAIQQFFDVFAWRNAVISFLQEKLSFNYANLETIPVPEP